MMSVVCIIIAVCACIICKKVYDSILNPVSIFVSVNILSIGLSSIQNFEFTYNNEFSFLVFIMFIFFFWGILLGLRTKHKNEKIEYIDYDKSNVLWVIILFGIIYDISVIAYLKNLFSNYSLLDFFLRMGEVNTYIMSDEYNVSWYNYIIPIGLPICLLCLFYLKYFEKNTFVIIQFLVSFLYCFSTRRDSLFNLIIILTIFTISLYKNNHTKKRLSATILKSVVISLAIIIVIMSSSQKMMNKSSDKPIEVCNMELPAYYTDSYLYVSLNYPYLQMIDYDYNSIPEVPLLATGRLGYMTLNRVLGTRIDVRSDFELKFRSIDGINFNTAPILYYAMIDFGIFFPLFFLILGIISQRMYYNYNSRSVILRILACIWYAVLILSFRGYLLIYLNIFLSIFYSYAIGRFIRLKRIQ